jgi:hypothetical protein
MNKLIRIGVLIICLFLIFSCKKERLKGDLDILTGKWNWSTSQVFFYGYSTSLYSQAILTPISENITYSIKFFQRGVFQLIKNDDAFEKWKILSKPNLYADNTILQNAYRYDIHLKDDDFLSGYVNQDTLVTIYYFPYNSRTLTWPDGEGHVYYYNYFVRE